jgi:hypothetical protein
VEWKAPETHSWKLNPMKATLKSGEPASPFPRFSAGEFVDSALTALGYLQRSGGFLNPATSGLYATTLRLWPRA